ncbi:MAG: hypothetical protein FK732_01545 [Asgard group archaeon]|nr:hypothetical protein [Asgard group archaeon]
MLSEINEKELAIIRNIEQQIDHVIVEELDFPSGKDVYFIQSEGYIISLSLSNLRLKEIPKEIAELKEIITLNLTGNQLISFPDSIKNSQKIAVLDLSHNKITSIQSWIENLSLLRVLKLNNNQLYSIPKAIGNCSLLRKIFLQNNQIHSLPIELLELKLLEEIHLDFRTTMHKKTKGVLVQIETRGCKVYNDYNRR